MNEDDKLVEVQEPEEEVDPWEAAFAAVAAANNPEPGPTGEEPDAGDGDGSGPDPEGPELEGLDGAEPVGPVPDLGADPADTGGEAHLVGYTVSAEEIESSKRDYQSRARERAIEYVRDAYVKQGVRNQNGRLGATISDPDICKKDERGVTRYYNPDTGREFSGDNPRHQAQQWVEAYNQELQRQFNEGCAQMEQKYYEEYAPAIRVLEFAPKYDRLDEVRRGMLDDLIEDYEVHDEHGDLIGYSCDLDKALGVVEKQIKRLSGIASSRKPAESPALDLKSSQKTATDKPEKKEYKSIAEAMADIEDQKLSKLRR